MRKEVPSAEVFELLSFAAQEFNDVQTEQRVLKGW